MKQFMFVGNYGGPLITEVYESDGYTPKLPVSATITVLNMDTDTTVLSGAACLVATGSAYYSIPSGSPITSTSAHLVAFMDVLVEAGNLLTNPIYIDVLDKSSLLILNQWRKKVQEAAPSEELVQDEDARDWIDAAVAFVNKNYRDTGYTSTLGTISPSPTVNDREFFAEVGSLMARTSWWAGRGKWRDEELSLDPGPFKDEWARLDAIMSKDADKNMMAVFDTFNRDRVQGDGYKEDSPLYWYRLSGSAAVTSTVGI